MPVLANTERTTSDEPANSVAHVTVVAATE
jgi:hypothetical protein